MRPEEIKEIEDRLVLQTAPLELEELDKIGPTRFASHHTNLEDIAKLLAALKEKEEVIKNLQSELKRISDSETPELIFPMCEPLDDETRKAFTKLMSRSADEESK